MCMRKQVLILIPYCLFETPLMSVCVWLTNHFLFLCVFVSLSPSQEERRCTCSSVCMRTCTDCTMLCCIRLKQLKDQSSASFACVLIHVIENNIFSPKCVSDLSVPGLLSEFISFAHFQAVKERLGEIYIFTILEIKFSSLSINLQALLTESHGYS